MKGSTFLRSHFRLAIFTVLLAVLMSTSAFAQGRGNGRGNGRAGRGRDFYQNGKCGKFVNCHDARDGRWDGRGPRRNVLRSRVQFMGPRIRERRRYDDQNRYQYSSRRYQMNRYWERRHEYSQRAFVRRYPMRQHMRRQYRY
ncbi:MAG: hypothetical protein JWM21_1948 [Acidobacteria bacterium]|nr:hypothetical protein [Acidobacteriota bacterium]